MNIKIGKVKQQRALDDVATMYSTATIVEKTQNSYKEVLICRENHYIDVSGEIAKSETENTFTVYVNKNIAEVLKEKEITDYEWIEPLTEVA